MSTAATATATAISPLARFGMAEPHNARVADRILDRLEVLIDKRPDDPGLRSAARYVGERLRIMLEAECRRAA